MPGKIADLNVKLGLDLTPFIREIKRVERRLNKFGRQLEGIGRDLTQKVTLPLAGLGGAAIKAFADFDKLQKGLEAVNDSSQAAAAQFDRLRKIAENPGIGLEQAVTGAIRLQAVGLSAKEAERTLLNVSKAVALTGGSAEQLNGVTVQLAQIASKGKVLSQDLRAATENAPALAKALVSAFGTIDGEAINEQVTGVDDFLNKVNIAIEQGEAFQKVQSSLGNEFVNLGISVKFALAQIGKVISDTIDLPNILQRVSKTIQDIADKFKALSPAAQKTIILIAGIAAAIGPVLLALGGFTTLLGTLAGGLTVLLSPVTAVIAGIAALSAGIVIAYQRSEIFRNIIDVIGKSLPALANVIISRFKAVGSLIGEIFGLIGDVIKILIGPFVSAFNRITQILGISFGDVKNFWESFGDLTVQSLADFVANIEGTFNGVVRFIKEFVKIVRENIGKFTDAFSDLGEGNLRSGFNKLAKALKLNNPIGSIKEEGRRLANAYKDGFKEAFDKVQADFSQKNKGLASLVGFSPSDFTASSDSSLVSKNDGTKKIGKVSFIKGANQLDGAFDAVSRLPFTAEQIREAKEEVKKLAEALPQVQERFTGLQEVALTAFDTFVNGFDEVLNSAESFGRGMIKVLGKVAQAAIQAAVSQVILKRLQSLGGFLGLAAVPLAAGAGKIAAGLFGKLISSIGIPFAKGGIVTGPTNALIGEAGPEAVIPLSPEKLRKYFPNQGGGGPVQIFLNDIMIAEAVERGQTKLDRIR